MSAIYKTEIDCTICLETLQESDSILGHDTNGRTYHVFHEDCYSTYVAHAVNQNYQPCCPLCRDSEVPFNKINFQLLKKNSFGELVVKGKSTLRRVPQNEIHETSEIEIDCTARDKIDSSDTTKVFAGELADTLKPWMPSVKNLQNYINNFMLFRSFNDLEDKLVGIAHGRFSPNFYHRLDTRIAPFIRQSDRTSLFIDFIRINSAKPREVTSSVRYLAAPTFLTISGVRESVHTYQNSLKTAQFAQDKHPSLAEILVKRASSYTDSQSLPIRRDSASLSGSSVVEPNPQLNRFSAKLQSIEVEPYVKTGTFSNELEPISSDSSNSEKETSEKKASPLRGDLASSSGSSVIVPDPQLNKFSVKPQSIEFEQYITSGTFSNEPEPISRDSSNSEKEISEKKTFPQPLPPPKYSALEPSPNVSHSIPNSPLKLRGVIVRKISSVCSFIRGFIQMFIDLFKMLI